MRVSLFLMLFPLFSQIAGQVNLVPNGSFEQYDSCTYDLDQVRFCTGWFKPTDGSSDYFNACSQIPFPSAPTAGVPVNGFGYQNAYHGSAYCGIRPYDDIDYKEYISCRLNVPLKSNIPYRFSIQVCLSELFSNVGVKSIGALFTDTMINIPGYWQTIFAEPQVEGKEFYTDTMNWKTLEGTFTAKGREEWLTIGCFRHQNLTDTLGIHNVNYVARAYYFVDDVRLYEIPLEAPNVFTPNGDGFNDVFFVSGLVEGDQVWVFNRWGTRVAEISSPGSVWDGRNTSGQMLEGGVYFYIVIAEGREHLKGAVQLFR